MKFSARPVFWSIVAVAVTAANFFAFRFFVSPPIADAHETVRLIIENGLVAASLALIFSLARGWRAAGFVAPRGFFWPLAGSVFWIGIIPALPGAMRYAGAEPGLSFAYVFIAHLVDE